MKHLTLLLLFSILLFSCRKDKEIKYTSDVPHVYLTHIQIEYDHYQNTSEVTGTFWIQEEITFGGARALELPSNSYLSVNGNSIIEFSNFRYRRTFNGMIEANIEYLDFDGTLYSNFIDSPDSTYFLSLTDTINADQDLEIDFYGSPLDSNESMIIYFGGYSDDYYHFADHDPDSNKTVVGEGDIQAGHQYPVTLMRTKRLSNPHLPAGGGGISYVYKSEKVVYAQ